MPTAADVAAGVDLGGRHVIVTGGAAGVGLETARALAGAGATVTLAVRDLAAGARAAGDIVATTDNKRIRPMLLDLADQSSVASFVAGWTGPLHILVNNAGVMATPLTRTSEGWELQFATNHLGHFALTSGLRPALAAAGGARVVSVSSSGHLRSPVVFDDVHFRARPYERWMAYAQSKTANILHAVEVTRRWADDGITANSLTPGVVRTNLHRYVTDADRVRMRAERGGTIGWRSPEQGAATPVLVAVSPLLDGVGGRYFEDCAEAGPHRPGTRRGVAAYALDPEAAARLWRVCAAMVAG